ncbi:CBS domain-containing protein [candidate division KSB1 bacterium]
MIPKDLISASIIPLKTSDTGSDALNLMDELKVSHLPIVNNVDFLGLISEEDIYNLNDLAAPIGDHKLSIKRSFIDKYQHIYDAIKLISELNLSLIPVLDDKNKYIGVITLQKLIEHFAHTLSINNPGGIIVLEINTSDYLLSEIAQIVESNDAKILSFYVTSYEDSTKMELTIKINRMDINGLLQTFNRYNYTIVASFSEKDYLDDLMERYDSLMNYLNI